VSPGRAKALNGAGGLAYWQNDFPTAGVFYTEQLATNQALGDAAGLAEDRKGWLSAPRATTTAVLCPTSR